MGWVTARLAGSALWFLWVAALLHPPCHHLLWHPCNQLFLGCLTILFPWQSPICILHCPSDVFTAGLCMLKWLHGCTYISAATATHLLLRTACSRHHTNTNAHSVLWRSEPSWIQLFMSIPPTSKLYLCPCTSSLLWVLTHPDCIDQYWLWQSALETLKKSLLSLQPSFFIGKWQS